MACVGRHRRVAPERRERLAVVERDAPSAEGSSTSSAGRSAAPGSLDLGPLTLIVACA